MSLPRLGRASRAFHTALLVGVHLTCLLAIFTGVRLQDLLLCGALYALRMFGVTAGYHRYFAHRSFKTSRLGQFALAVLAVSSGQRGVLWWAWHHRHHHRHSDGSEDLHSPRRDGFWRSHMLWWMDDANRRPDLSQVRDLTRYPELRALERGYALPPLLLSALCYAIGGPAGFVVGFCWSTVLVWHVTFTINSLAHIYGSQPFETGDDSRNNFWLALLTLGEGWHNNHHHYQTSTRQGFLWWEIDLTWYALFTLERMGLVWGLRSPPPRVMDQRRSRAQRRAEVEASVARDEDPAGVA